MRKLVTATALMAVMALGLWFGLGSAASSAKPAANKAAKVSAPARQSKGSARHVRPVSLRLNSVKKAATSASESTGESDQGGSDESATESSSGESNGESTSSNETDTHEDPQGQDVNHECPPNCDTANGEQP